VTLRFPEGKFTTSGETRFRSDDPQVTLDLRMLSWTNERDDAVVFSSFTQPAIAIQLNLDLALGEQPVIESVKLVKGAVARPATAYDLPQIPRQQPDQIRPGDREPTEADLQCVRHLKKLYLAIMAYARDHQGQLPQAVPLEWVREVKLGKRECTDHYARPCWSDTIRDYLEEENPEALFLCPAAGDEAGNMHYSLAWEIGYTYEDPETSIEIEHYSKKLSEIKDPARTPLIYELRGGTWGDVWCASRGAYGDPRHGREEYRVRRHQGGTYVLFCDGHVEWFAAP